MRANALATVRALRQKSSADRPRLDLITLALHGKKIGFEKVIKMIDGMIGTLKKEQVDDNNKKEYCGTQMDSSDDKKKALERSVSDLASLFAKSFCGEILPFVLFLFSFFFHVFISF